MTLWTWAGVAVLGGLGAVLRVVLTHGVARRVRGPLPLGTLAVNLGGSLLLGLLVGLEPSSAVLQVLGTGLLGALTTFSAWMFEARRLAADGRRRDAAALIGVSVALGLALFAIGRTLGKAVA